VTEAGANALLVPYRDAQRALEAASALGILDPALKIQRTDRGLLLEVMDGEAFLPLLIRSFGERITGIHIQRPSLNEVFLHLTGREFRP
jgi:ABC-2 type transport system ATP-binding protein